MNFKLSVALLSFLVALSTQAPALTEEKKDDGPEYLKTLGWKSHKKGLNINDPSFLSIRNVVDEVDDELEFYGSKISSDFGVESGDGLYLKDVSAWDYVKPQNKLSVSVGGGEEEYGYALRSPSKKLYIGEESLLDGGDEIFLEDGVDVVEVKKRPSSRLALFDVASPATDSVIEISEPSWRRPKATVVEVNEPSASSFVEVSESRVRPVIRKQKQTVFEVNEPEVQSVVEVSESRVRPTIRKQKQTVFEVSEPEVQSVVEVSQPRVKSVIRKTQPAVEVVQVEAPQTETVEVIEKVPVVVKPRPQTVVIEEVPSEKKFIKEIAAGFKLKNDLIEAEKHRLVKAAKAAKAAKSLEEKLRTVADVKRADDVAFAAENAADLKEEAQMQAIRIAEEAATAAAMARAQAAKDRVAAEQASARKEAADKAAAALEIAAQEALNDIADATYNDKQAAREVYRQAQLAAFQAHAEVFKATADKTAAQKIADASAEVAQAALDRLNSLTKTEKQLAQSALEQAQARAQRDAEVAAQAAARRVEAEKVAAASDATAQAAQYAAIRDRALAKQAYEEKIEADSRASHSANLVSNVLDRIYSIASAEKVAAADASLHAKNKALHDKADSYKAMARKVASDRIAAASIEELEIAKQKAQEAVLISRQAIKDAADGAGQRAVNALENADEAELEKIAAYQRAYESDQFGIAATSKASQAMDLVEKASAQKVAADKVAAKASGIKGNRRVTAAAKLFHL